MITHIYTLIDPRDQQPRYVGKANSPADRLADHLYEAKRNFRTHKNRWLHKLSAAGFTPIIRILERCDESIWEERESYWIARLRAEGVALTNATNGGEGGRGRGPVSNEARVRFREGARRRWSIPEERAKQSERARRRHDRDPEHVRLAGMKLDSARRSEFAKARRGEKRSQEARLNMSAAAKLRAKIYPMTDLWKKRWRKGE